MSPRTAKFSTRHSASGILTNVEGTFASLTGYFPQDLVGKSIMDFYHPEDMSLLKETYELVIARGQLPDSSFCSRPYRFLIHNGCYVSVETEWSIFVNPWSRKLECVLGSHRVLQGK